MTTRRGRQGSHFPMWIVGHRVGLQMVPDVLHRIEFGGVRGKEGQAHGRRAGQKHPNRLRTVGLPPVPDHEEGLAFELPGKLPQEREHPRCLDVGRGVQTEIATDGVALGGDTQRGDRRYLLVGPTALIQHRRSPFRRPAPPDVGRHQEAGFVDEHQGGLQPRGVFFTRGHSSLTQRRISLSSRSTARRWGFWGLHPKACRRRPIWSTW